MKRIILPIILLILVVAVVFGFKFVKKETHFLNLNPNQNDIKNNNELNTNLTRKEVIVSDTYKKGVFEDTQYLNIPNDHEIEVFVGDMRSPRSFAFDENENLYITDKGAGQVIVVEAGTTDKKVFATGLKNAHGIEYHEGYLYVAEEDNLKRYKLDQNDPTKFTEDKDLIALSPGGIHVTRTVRIGPDEKIYISTGSSCNVCEEKDKRKAAIATYNMDGTGEQIMFEGLRNSVGFIIKDNMIWSVDNGRDMLGDDKPTEEVNVFDIANKNHMGWPYCHGRAFVNPEYPERTEFCGTSTTWPMFEIQAHSAPLGLDFDDSNNLFVALHGSWNRTTPTGYKIIAFDVDKFYEEMEALEQDADVRGITKDEQESRNQDYYNKRYEDFITGWLSENGDVWGRPVDVLFNSAGDMFITDDRAGVVYRVYKSN